MTVDALGRHAEQAGFTRIPSDIVLDVERCQPALVDTLEPLCPDIRQLLTGLRQTLPVAPDAAEGIKGQFYRLPRHYRSVCCALHEVDTPERLWDGDVVTFKGTEPLMPDFDGYLRWMMTARFRGAELPLGLHFPLRVNVPPGAMPLDECEREQRMALAVHQRHLRIYGELAQAPVPLLVHRCSTDATVRYVDTIRHHLTPQAFERVEARARAGCGVSIWYYPSAPIRVDDLSTLAAANPHFRIRTDEGERTVESWCRQFARFLHLGFMPYAPWNHGRGSCVDAGNACIDGGFADLLMLVPFESIPDDRWFRLSVLASVNMLCHTVSVFSMSVGPGPTAQPDASLDPLSQMFLRSRLLEQIEATTPPGAAPDPRVLSCFKLDRFEALVDTTCSSDPRPDTPYRGTASAQPQ